MTVRNLRPNETLANNGFAQTPNIALHAVLSDDLGFFTYARGQQGDTFRVGVQNETAENQRIAGVRVQASVFGKNYCVLLGYYRTAGTNYISLFFSGVPGASPGRTIRGAWFYPHPETNDEWTFAQLNNAEFFFDISSMDGDEAGISVWGAALDADIRQKPIVRITRPNTFHTFTNTLEVMWSFDADGEPQNKERVKVFTQAVAEGPGFNPDTSTFEYDSLIQKTQSYNRHVVPAGVLDPDTIYYVAVRGSTIFPHPTNGNEDWWSDWDVVAIKTASRPVVNITSQSGGVATHAQPVFNYTFTDADGKAETNTVMRLYLGNGSGVDPDHDAPYWEGNGTGGTMTMVGAWQTLSNGQQYTLFAQSIAGNIKSFWDSNTFTATLDAPNPPTITATAQPNNARVQLVIGWTNGDTPPVTGFIVERSIDDGATWERARGVVLLPPTALGSNPRTLHDYFAPFGVAIRYRAATVGGTITTLVQSAWTTTASPGVTLNVTKVWVKSLSDPANNSFHVMVQDTWLKRTHRKRRAFFEPLSRDDVVSFREAGKMEKFTMTFLTLDTTLADQLEAILDANAAILIQSGRRQWYVEVETDFEIGQGLWDEMHGREEAATFAVPFREITAPIVGSI